MTNDPQEERELRPRTGISSPVVVPLTRGSILHLYLSTALVVPDFTQFYKSTEKKD